MPLKKNCWALAYPWVLLFHFVGDATIPNNGNVKEPLLYFTSTK